MNADLAKKIEDLIGKYNTVLKSVDKNAEEDEVRAYGGVVRSEKGKLQEYITEEIVMMAWESIGGESSRISINSKKQKIPIRKDYILQLEDDEVKRYILSNLSEYYFGLSVDKQVFVDGEFVIGIESKAYM